MRIAFKGLAFAAYLSAAACTPASLSETERAQIESEVRDAILAFAEHVNAGNGDGASLLYTDEAGFHWIENGRIAYETKAAATSALKGGLEQYPGALLTISDIRVTPLSRDAAVATAGFNQELGDFSFSGVMTIALRDEGAEWRFVVGHASSPIPDTGTVPDDPPPEKVPLEPEKVGQP